MAALKKSSILLAVAILALMSSSTASAQGPVPQTLGTISCVATATPVTVRAEGIAELVGDIVLTCTNLPPTAGGTFRNYLTTNISVSLAAVNVTNNINFGHGVNVVDTSLIVNGNNTIDLGNGAFVAGTEPVPTPGIFPAIGSGLDERFQRPQFGVLAANNRVEWNGVQFPVPGAPNGAGATTNGFCGTDADFNPDDFTNNPNGCFPSTTNIRITSMRANASMLGVPGQATFPSTQVTAFVSITGETLPPITNNVLNVAVPLLGLLTDVEGAVAGLQCVDEDGVTVNVELEEGFATSFKTLGVASSAPGDTQDESGYFAVSPNSNNGGGASQATRFIARFFNIPEGVEISVSRQVTNLVAPNNLILQLVEGTDANGAGGTVSVGTGTVEVSLSGGFGVAVYEVLQANPSALENVNFPITVSWEADTANDLPAIGSGQVSVSFAPVSTVLTASLGAPEPRFIDTNPDPQTIVTISRCTTTILFPFVTNQSAFDTGLVISNTSDDWQLMNTEPQDGACTIHHIGSTTGGGAAPPDATSDIIGAGEQLVWTLSGGNQAQGVGEAAEFQGYIIAVCEFQYGHGFAFITNGFGGIPTIAHGYLALIIPFDGASRHAGDWHYYDNGTSNGFVWDGFGERLAH